MTRYLLVGAAILAVVCSWAQTRTVVASSGAPSVILAGNPPDITNPTLNRLGLGSGNLGAGLEERWTAFQFFLSQTCTFDGIEVYWFDVTGAVPTQYGWVIYADNGSDAPGTVLYSGTGNIANLTIGGRSWPHFGADKAAVFPTGTITLGRGKYWATVYGVDGNIPMFCGAPGGATNNFAYRKTTVGSAYAKYETKAFSVPNYQGRMDGGWQQLGSGPPYNYSGWNANELPGRCLYRVAYVIADTTISNGSYVTGTLKLTQWPDDPPFDYFPGGDGSNPMQIDVHFCDPSTGYPQIIETVSLANDGSFITDVVRDGTYDVKIYIRDWFIGRYTCGSFQQLNVSGFGHSFLGKVIPNVTVGGLLYDIGTVTLTNGDANLDAAVSLQDLNRILINFGSSVNTNDGCATEPNWANYYPSDDTNYDGDIALSDLNTILLNFGSSGPARW